MFSSEMWIPSEKRNVGGGMGEGEGRKQGERERERLLKWVCSFKKSP